MDKSKNLLPKLIELLLIIREIESITEKNLAGLRKDLELILEDLDKRDPRT